MFPMHSEGPCLHSTSEDSLETLIVLERQFHTGHGSHETKHLLPSNDRQLKINLAADLLHCGNDKLLEAVSSIRALAHYVDF
jgi:predicted NBD/HSP70 family sugar kinase